MISGEIEANWFAQIYLILEMNFCDNTSLFKNFLKNLADMSF